MVDAAVRTQYCDFKIPHFAVAPPAAVARRLLLARSRREVVRCPRSPRKAADGSHGYSDLSLCRGLVQQTADTGSPPFRRRQCHTLLPSQDQRPRSIGGQGRMVPHHAWFPARRPENVKSQGMYRGRGFATKCTELGLKRWSRC